MESGYLMEPIGVKDDLRRGISDVQNDHKLCNNKKKHWKIGLFFVNTKQKVSFSTIWSQSYCVQKSATMRVYFARNNFKINLILDPLFVFNRPGVAGAVL